MKVKPFRGIRPPRELVESVQSRPYDVLDSEEARAEAEGNPHSLYHIIKPEIDFPTGTSEYAPEVYQQAVTNYRKFLSEGWLKQDDRECYYIYAQTMNGKTQYGLVLGAAVDDYLSGKIKKHELTRKDKEEDRMKHVRITNANIEPVFLAYRSNDALAALIKRYADRQPEYDFIAADGIGHTFRIVTDNDDIQTITSTFAEIPAMYIADGHHRSAAAALVGAEKAAHNPAHKGDEEYNFFMAVCFDAEELTILPYNRVIKDLNGMNAEQLLEKLSLDFNVTPKGRDFFRPSHSLEAAMYLEGEWYRLEVKPNTYNNDDPVESLDVAILSRNLLDKVFGIKDLRTDKRVDFIGGIRGQEELKRLVDNGEWKVALALSPVTMNQVMKIADAGKIMPPKATWFEPKLRSGLVIHSLN